LQPFSRWTNYIYAIQILCCVSAALCVRNPLAAKRSQLIVGIGIVIRVAQNKVSIVQFFFKSIVNVKIPSKTRLYHPKTFRFGTPLS
jgi:hypothetical protein